MKKAARKNQTIPPQSELPPNAGVNESGQPFAYVAGREEPIPLAGQIIGDEVHPIRAPAADAPRQAFVKLADKFLAANRALYARQQALWRCEAEGEKPAMEIHQAIKTAGAACSEAEIRFAAKPALNRAELDLKFRAIATAEDDCEATSSDGVELFGELMKSAFRDLRKLTDCAVPLTWGPGSTPRAAFARLASDFVAASRAYDAAGEQYRRCEEAGIPKERASLDADEAHLRRREIEERFANEPARNHAELDLKFRAIALAEFETLGEDEKTMTQCAPIFEGLAQSAFRDLRRLPDRTGAGDFRPRPKMRVAEPEEPMPASAESIALRHDFQRLYTDWLSARAAVSSFDASAENDEGKYRALDDALQAAERALLTTPAPLDWCLWMKWEALDLLVIGEATSGEYHDRRVISALGSVKADVVRLLGELA